MTRKTCASFEVLNVPSSHKFLKYIFSFCQRHCQNIIYAERTAPCFAYCLIYSQNKHISNSKFHGKTTKVNPKHHVQNLYGLLTVQQAKMFSQKNEQVLHSYFTSYIHERILHRLVLYLCIERQ